MGVQRFEDLKVWQEGKLFAEEIALVLREGDFTKDPEIRSQLNSAALSIVANIAEGFVRGRHKEFAQFARIAAGSAAEARALLLVAAGRHYVTAARSQSLLARTDAIGRMLRRLIEVLESR